jgi:hypothetical protein
LPQVEHLIELMTLNPRCFEVVAIVDVETPMRIGKSCQAHTGRESRVANNQFQAGSAKMRRPDSASTL